MRPITATVGPLAAGSANNIALSQTPTGGAFVLNGSLAQNGIAYMDNPRRVLITTTDTTHTFTITGTTPTGSVISEVVKNSGSSVTSALDYATVTSVNANATPSAASTIGTTSTGGASTPWVRLDEWADAPVSIQCDVSGTVNYTIQSSNDDPNSPTDPVLPSAMTWINTNDSNGVNATGAVLTNYLFSGTFIRVLLNSGTGSVTMKSIQYNVSNR